MSFIVDPKLRPVCLSIDDKQMAAAIATSGEVHGGGAVWPDAASRHHSMTVDNAERLHLGTTAS